MDAVSLADLEAAARERLDPGVHGYFAGGAGDEVTLRDNRAAFGRWRLRPRVGVDVSRVDTGVELIGPAMRSPVIVAPVAFQRLVDPEGELAMAAACAAEDTIMCLSTLATARPAEIAEQVPGTRLWFQLYAFRDPGVTRDLMEEAIASGAEALVVTVDAPRAGRRERDLRTGFAIPADLGVPSLQGALGTHGAMDIQEVFGQIDPAFDWDDFGALARECRLPVIAKGVMTGEDAELAIASGAGGIAVSNHGGRQLDCVPASLDVLPEVVEAVAGRVPVTLDGGIRRGTDVAIALSLGADAVMAGRAALWGLAAAGRPGAEQALALLREEFELALTLLGLTSPSELGPSSLLRNG